jgi:hypothetical protein
MKKGNFYERRSEAKAREKPSPIGEIPMLELDMRTKATNIDAVKDALNIYVQRTFQHIGSCIDMNRLKTYEMPTLEGILQSFKVTATVQSSSGPATAAPPSTFSNDEREVAKSILIEELKHQRKTQHETTRELSALYGVVYGTLSLTSRDSVTSSPEYRAIRESDNGFELWKLTYKIHTAGGTNETEERRQDRVLKEYMGCRKETIETLAQFHSRSKDRIREMAATSQIISEQIQAIRFIDSLDNVTFYEFKRMIENGPTLGVAYPATLAAALEAANNFVPPNMNHKSHRDNTLSV